MGLLVELILSWLVLRLLCKKDFAVLGVFPTKDRVRDLQIGFLMAALCCAFNYLLQTIFSGSTWRLNLNFSLKNALSSSWWVINSVLYEELIFRGALLYLAIEKLGIWKACIVSAICFGIYHWFSMNAWGNGFQMIYLFVTTGLWGYIFALAFAKTRSLYLPIGLHFGWNLLNTVIFSQGPLGDQLLILKVGSLFNLIENIIVVVLSVLAVPLLVLWYLKWLNTNQKIEAQVTTANTT